MVTVDGIGKSDVCCETKLSNHTLYYLIKRDLKRLIKNKKERKCILQAIKVIGNID